MDIYGDANSAITDINTNQPATLRVSTGSTSNPNLTPTPTYAAPVSITAQVQDLTTDDIAHLDSLNIQGSERAIYARGSISAIIRVSQNGGDLITLQDGSVWLTTRVFEKWPTWCKVAVTLQNGS